MGGGGRREEWSWDGGKWTFDLRREERRKPGGRGGFSLSVAEEVFACGSGAGIDSSFRGEKKICSSNRKFGQVFRGSRTASKKERDETRRVVALVRSVLSNRTREGFETLSGGEDLAEIEKMSDGESAWHWSKGKGKDS